MSDKAEQTKAHILEKVAPVFNRKGYVATSLTDLTTATGLTKGAIYCHYESKEDLAVHAYKLMVKKVLFPLSDQLNRKFLASEQLEVLTSYYRHYHKLADTYGGCPVLNIGVDAHYTNSKLYELARDISKRLEQDLKEIIENAVDEGFLIPEIEADVMAGKIFSMIEGGIFMSTLHQDGAYLSRMMDEVDSMIANNRRG